MKQYLIALRRLTVSASFFVVAALIIALINSAIHFPYDVDAPLTQQEAEAARKYYTEAYRTPVNEDQAQSEYETKYLQVAAAAAKTFHIEEQVTTFVKD